MTCGDWENNKLLLKSYFGIYEFERNLSSSSGGGNKGKNQIHLNLILLFPKNILLSFNFDFFCVCFFSKRNKIQIN